MKQMIHAALTALSLSLVTLNATPAAADPGHGHGRGDGRHDERHGGKHDRGRHDDGRHGDRRHDWDRHYARHDDRDWHRGRDWDHRDWRRHHDWRDHREVRRVYVYDWNRPDPRYRGYYADRYYRDGYAPIRVTRYTRIYRGYDDRYYCRRSDGTTGLILGATLGGLLGNSLGRGHSDTAATLIGAGAGALLGREIDRGELVCR